MRVTVAEGQAVNHDGRQYTAGETFDVDGRLAMKRSERMKWSERLHVIPAKEPAKKAAPKKATRKAS